MTDKEWERYLAIDLLKRIKNEETHEREIDRRKALDLAIKALEQPKTDWIPCSERLPSEADFIASYRRNKYSAEFIVMIEGATRPTTLYFRKTGIWVDENGNPYRVIAWQPLPEPYNPGMVRKQTNADRIRAMSATDDGLAELLYQTQYGYKKVEFCRSKEECSEILDSGGTIPDEMCKQCLVEWLQSEVEETYE